MSESTGKSDLSLFDTIDFRAFLETLRLRWWVIPALITASVGFLQAQESDLRTEPTSYVVSRSFEVGYPQYVLNSVGIRNDAVREFPDPSTQILILQSDETRQEISDALGLDIDVKVPNDFETPFTLSCNLPVVTDCEKAIEAYVAKAIKIRGSAIAAGLENLKTLLVGLQESAPDPLLPPQIAAIESLSKSLKVEFAFIDGYEQAIGSTVEQVRRPTYLMGVVAGLVISFLILLQLTYTDSRVRSVRQLVRLIGEDTFLGRVTKRENPVRDRRVAISILRGLRTNSVTRLRYLTLRESLHDETALLRLATLTDASHEMSKPFSELSVPELGTSSTTHVDILIVQRNRDLRKDVLEALSGLRRSDRKLAGVLLVG